MKILVTGSYGQVGSVLVASGRASGHEITAMPRSRLDITDEDDVCRAVLSAGCHLVVNAAAYTDVEGAESHRRQAMAVNQHGAANLATACHQAGMPLIHISTDYVFDGRKSQPYIEDDATRPLNVYGESKLAGELEVRSRLERHIIIRTGWLYARRGRNFVSTIQRLGAEDGELRVVDQERGTPTPATAIVDTILQIAGSISDNVWGTYHYAARGSTTWFGFAAAICEASGLAPELVAIGSDEYSGTAVRPRYSVLGCERIESVFGVTRPHWKAALVDTLATDAD